MFGTFVSKVKLDLGNWDSTQALSLIQPSATCIQGEGAPPRKKKSKKDEDEKAEDQEGKDAAISMSETAKSCMWLCLILTGGAL